MSPRKLKHDAPNKSSCARVGGHLPRRAPRLHMALWLGTVQGCAASCSVWREKCNSSETEGGGSVVEILQNEAHHADHLRTKVCGLSAQYVFATTASTSAEHSKITTIRYRPQAAVPASSTDSCESRV